MCYAVFIATPAPLQTVEFIPAVTKLYLRLPNEKEMAGLGDKFTMPYIYYVGSDSKCSCGFQFYSWRFDDPEWQDKSSPSALLNLLNQLTISDDVEYYCCWDGDWNELIESTRVLNSHKITLENNYFELVEREHIRFERMKSAVK